MLEPSKLPCRRGTEEAGGLGRVLLAEHLGQVAEGPHVELALDTLRVGVFRRVEAAVGMVEVGEQVVEGGAGDLDEAGLVELDA